MNTSENNKLLAEFLGAKNNGQDEYDMYGLIPTIEDGADEKHFFTPELMPFAASWDWIMQVVDKINYIEDYRFTVNIQSMDVQIQDHKKGGNVVDFFSGESTDKLINSIYTACIEFVKWYNEQNKKS